MFTVALYAKIRHAVMIDGLSRREAAKRFGVHRNTITKMLSFSVPPGYRERPASKKLGPYLAWIDAILEGDSQVHFMVCERADDARCGHHRRCP
jgi:transposase